MELEEMKNAWKDLNARLEQTEVMNKRIVNDLLNTRQKSAKEKLMRYEVFFLVFSFSFAGLTLFPYLMGIYSPLMTLVFEIIFVFAGFWQMYKIGMLHQIQIDKCSTSDLIRKTIRFKVVTQMRTVIGLIVGIPLLILLFVFDKSITTEMMWGGCIGGIIGLAIGLALFFKHMKGINSLLDSYKALDDFQSEHESA